ncbi:hypothetical protein [Citrobacter amalonaticus]|uniref:hypothetical protein n=1 Tax=Citrobacter amalonaticus TaxID=35703 RepID=UPI00300D7018
MNKITLAVIVALFAAPFVVPEAHAINAHYRDQLIRSGCTQVTEANGTCDIHKTKAQNEARFATDPAVKERREIQAFINDSLLGSSIQDANSALENYGFHPVDAGIFGKGAYRIHLGYAHDQVVTAVLK